MNKIAVLLVLIILAVVIVYLSMPTPKKAGEKTQTKPLECVINHNIDDTNWALEGTIRYENPRIRVEGTVSSEGGAVDVLVLSDNKETFLYGTMRPISNPSDIRWYDATDLDIPGLVLLSDNLANGTRISGMTCREVSSINDSVFNLPEDAVLNPVPAGGLREYY